MSKKCGHCENTFAKNDVCLECDYCGSSFHSKCATLLTPSLTKGVVDTVKKTGGNLIYKCNNCVTGRNTKSDGLTSKLDNLEKYMQDISAQLVGIKKDLCSSMSRNDTLEKVVNLKIKKLEADNNNLRKQMNRSDIIISGLPSTITNDNLYSYVVDLAKALGVNITLPD